jgi:hypothetical protein
MYSKIVQGMGFMSHVMTSQVKQYPDNPIVLLPGFQKGRDIKAS